MTTNLLLTILIAVAELADGHVIQRVGKGDDLILEYVVGTDPVTLAGEFNTPLRQI